MAISIRNLLVRVDENGNLELTASEIIVGVLAKQAKPFSVFNPGAASDPPPSPRREERVSPEPQPRISAVAPEPSPVAPDPPIDDGFVEPAKVRDVIGPFVPKDPPKMDLPGIKRFMSEGVQQPAVGKKRKKQKYKRIPPEQRKERHSLKGPDNRHFIKRPVEPGAAQPTPSPAELTWEARKAAADAAAAEAMQKEAAAIIAMQKATAAAITLKTPAAKEALKQAKATAFALRKVTKEAIRIRNLSRYKHWEAERNKKGQIMSRASEPPLSEPELSEPELYEPEPARPAPPPPAAPTALILASAKKKFGVPPTGQPRAGDAPLSFPGPGPQPTQP